ncbi:MAG: tetratricopeptide repeat protein [Bacteroidetes bacterium]|nr:tetratricopeptide repeat protein [Bacteroidota bacterium]
MNKIIPFINKKYRLRQLKFLLLFALLLPYSTYAQRTQDDVHSIALYKKGKELFDAKQFASAQKVFMEFSKLSDDYNLRGEAGYYIALSSLELTQADAELTLTQYADKYREHPRARTILYYLGRFQYRNREFAKAIATLENVDAYDLTGAERSEHAFMLGYSYYKTNNLQKASTYFGKIKDNADDNGYTAAYYVGYIAYQKKKYSETLKEFTKIKNVAKFKATVPGYISQIYLMQGDYDKTIEFGKQALENAESKGANEVSLFLAEAYFLKKDCPNASQYYNQYVEAGGALPDHHLYQLGYCLYQQEKYKEALDAFSAINIKDDSLGQNIAFHLANCYQKTGNENKARSSYEFCMKRSFNKNIKEISLFNFAKLSYKLNFDKEAIESFKTFIKTYPGTKSTAEAKTLLSQILLAANNPKEAMDVLETIPDRNEKLDEAYQKVCYLYGMELYSSKMQEEAIPYLKKSLEFPYDRRIKALCNFWIGEYGYKLARYDDAITRFKNFLFVSESSETPFANIANYNIAYSYFKKEDYKYALIYFKKFIKAEKRDDNSPRLTDAQLRAGDCNFIRKDYKDALNNYQVVIDDNANEGDYAMYQKGIIQGLLRMPTDKIATMRSLAKKYPSSAYLDDALFTVGEELKKKGDYADAIQAFNYLNQNYPKNPYYRLAMLNVGLIYFNQEKDDKAVAVCRTIIQKYPYSDEAKQALKTIENSYIERGMTDSLQEFYKVLPNSSLTQSKVDSSLYSSAYNNVRSNDCDAAIKSLKIYLDKFPNGYSAVEASYYMAECGVKTKDTNTAFRGYNYVIAKSPNQYVERALVKSAEMLFLRKDYQTANSRYQQLEDLATLKQNSLLALNGQLRSYYFLKNYEKSIELSNKILNTGFADEESKLGAQFIAAKSHLELNQLAQALALFTQVQKASKNQIGAEALYECAHINYMQEKYTEAEDMVMKIKDNYSSYDDWRAKGFILLADIYTKKGDVFNAKNILQSIIDNYDDEGLKAIAKQKLEVLKSTEKKTDKKEEEE